MIRPKLGVIAAIACFALQCVLADHANAAEEKRIALIIGNNKYSSAALRNPVNDATAMAAKLQSLGFEVLLKTDVTQRQMTRAISEFADKLAPGSVALFYYAGHGLQARGRNYLVPIDAEITSEGTVSTESVDVERVLDQLTRTRLAMVILDACRNNPFERRFRSGAGSGLASIDAPAGTLIAYATAPGRIALDGDGRHGTYTEALLKAMDSPGVKVEDVFKQVRREVLKVTSNQQIPWESSSLTGEFVFRPGNSLAAEDARKKFEEETAALRKQMALLSTEMAKMHASRNDSTTTLARTEEAQKKAESEAATLREQLALMTAEISRLRDSRPAPGATPAEAQREQRKSEQAAAAMRDQVASLNAELSKLEQDKKPAGPSLPPVANAQTLAPAPAARTETVDWAKQIAKFEAVRGKASLAGAIAALLDISSGEELTQLRAFETSLDRRSSSSALALGVDGAGFLVWGGSYAQVNRYHATELALDFCVGAGATKCKVVSADARFAESGFADVVRQLTAQPVEAVRAAFMNTLRQALAQPPSNQPFPTFLSPTRTSMGYSSPRRSVN